MLLERRGFLFMKNTHFPPSHLNCGDKTLNLTTPAVMGVINLTPDSFSDGGQLHTDHQLNTSKVLFKVEAMIKDGADIIDLGGESTRPGAEPVSVQQELERVIPVLQALAANFDTIFSVDTSSPQVILEAQRAGANLINDVRALRRQGALDAAVETGLPVCLMHMQNEPKAMQRNPKYKNVVSEVIEFLDCRKQQCIAAGIGAEQLLLDPGFGFGKTLQHNLALFDGLDQLAKQQHPIVVGVSRKSMIGQLLDVDVDERLIGSVTMAVLAAQKIQAAEGAVILRVHDVRETVQALRVLGSVN